MLFKFIIVFVNEDLTDEVLDASRLSGATGATVVNHAHGNGIDKAKSFWGLNLEINNDVVLLLVEEHLSREIIEKITEVGKFDDSPGAGIAFQINVEDAVGISHQLKELTEAVEKRI